jgi:predicted ribosome quality control (RQC) complex YloA/Tae2 family protein
MERVEEALRSVNGLVSRGMDWGDIERLINHERTRGNPVAEIILKCMFKEGKLVVGLREEEEEEEENSNDETDEEEGEESGELINIEVDLGLSALGNAREYFERKKVAAEKVCTSGRGLICRNLVRHNHHRELSKTLNERSQQI